MKKVGMYKKEILLLFSSLVIIFFLMLILQGVSYCAARECRCDTDRRGNSDTEYGVDHKSLCTDRVNLRSVVYTILMSYRLIGHQPGVASVKSKSSA